MTKDSHDSEVTVPRSELLTGMTVGTLQEDFALSEADFLRLKASESPTKTWAVNFLFAAIGFGISIAPKWLGELAGKTDKVTSAEWGVFFGGVLISAILYGIGWLLPNDRKSTMRKIEKHFQNAPKSRQLMRGKKK